MAVLSLIPGAAANNSVRLLIIARDAGSGLPKLQLNAAGATISSHTVGVPIVVRSSPRLAQALADARVSVFDLEVMVKGSPLSAARVRVTVTMAGQSRTVELQTLPKTVPAEGLSFIVASCFDVQFNMGEKLRAALAATLPGHPAASFQLWVGDNVYLDIPGFPDGEPYALTLDRYLKYLLHDALGGARRMHTNFTTYDDHEFWNDYPESQIQVARSRSTERPVYEAAAQDCLELFQSHLNPQTGPNSRSYRIDFTNVSFFVGDTRSRRTLGNVAPTRAGMLTRDDLTALKDWCRDLQQPGVLVLGQPLWSEPKARVLFTTADHNLPHFRAQYEQIWTALRQAPFDILVISGDIHYSRMLRLSMQNAANRNIFELVTSPASEIPSGGSTVTQFLFGAAVKQGRVTPDAPSVVEGSAQKLRAACLFGTSSPNTFARVTLRPHASVGMQVGVSFVDYARGPAALAPFESVRGLPKWGTKTYQVCHEPHVCMLRER